LLKLPQGARAEHGRQTVFMHIKLKMTSCMASGIDI
jgi:hypothetical protein